MNKAETMNAPRVWETEMGQSVAVKKSGEYFM